MKFVPKVVAAALLVSMVPTANAASLHRKYAYFTIHGNTAADLDRELRRRGPYLESDREHHAGAATMRFETTVKYALRGHTCRIVKADVTLRVTVTLPRWRTSRPPADPYLAIVWDVLSHDIRRHEEEHVRIAHDHANRLERSLRRLRPTKGCDALKRKVQQTTRIELARDDRAQSAFDRRERANFRSRFKRLLDERVKTLKRR
jgi:predicted secreted Zn-dependent protease